MKGGERTDRNREEKERGVEGEKERGRGRERTVSNKAYIQRKYAHDTEKGWTPHTGDIHPGMKQLYDIVWCNK